MTDSDLLDFEELRKFIRREHGPIGWEYQVGVMQERAERQAARIRELEQAVEFAAGAIEDAIYLEDGLDGASGEATLKLLRDAHHTIPARPHKIWNEAVAHIRELEDALRPFAQHDWSFSSAPDEAPIQVPGLAIEDITLGDLKRAAAALRGKRGDSHE